MNSPTCQRTCTRSCCARGQQRGREASITCDSVEKCSGTRMDLSSRKQPSSSPVTKRLSVLQSREFQRKANLEPRAPSSQPKRLPPRCAARVAARVDQAAEQPLSRASQEAPRVAAPATGRHLPRISTASPAPDHGDSISSRPNSSSLVPAETPTTSGDCSKASSISHRSSPRDPVAPQGRRSFSSQGARRPGGPAQRMPSGRASSALRNRVQVCRATAECAC